MADGSSTAMFIADSPALDFLNTIYSPGDTAVETIDNGEAYLAWLMAAGLVPEEVRRSFAKEAGPGELDAVAAQARALREWFRAFVQKYRGKALVSGEAFPPSLRDWLQERGVAGYQAYATAEAGVIAYETAARDGLVVGKGVFFSEVLGFDKEADKNTTLLLLPPRYVGHEEMFARTYRISGTCDVGLRKAWSWLREAFGFGAKKAPAGA